MIQHEPNMIEQIFRLLETKNFEQLSDSERAMLRPFMSEAEYNELYTASRKTSSYFKEGISPSSEIKKNLSEIFKEKHHQKKSVFTYRIELWKAAAILIPLILAGLWAFNQRTINHQLATIVHRDTIIVQQKIKEVQRIFDTVVSCRHVSLANKRKHLPHHALVSNNSKDSSRYRSDQGLNIGIRTFQAEDLRKELPNKNGTTMQEDELLKHFSFARI